MAPFAADDGFMSSSSGVLKRSWYVGHEFLRRKLAMEGAAAAFVWHIALVIITHFFASTTIILPPPPCLVMIGRFSTTLSSNGAKRAPAELCGADPPREVHLVMVVCILCRCALPKSSLVCQGRIPTYKNRR